MTSTFLRIGLIISLIISMFVIGGILFFNEIFVYHGTIGQLFPTAMLFLTQMVLQITLYVTKKSKPLLIVFIVNAVLIIILFASKFHTLEDFVKDYENRFNELMAKYPNGERPDVSDWRLITPHILIKEQQCCAKDLVIPQNSYYELAVDAFCVAPEIKSFAPNQFKAGAPCLNFARVGQEALRGSQSNLIFLSRINYLFFLVLITSLIVSIIVLILYGIYIYLCRRDEQAKLTTGMAGTTYPTVIDQWAHQPPTSFYPPIPPLDEKQ